MFLETQPFLLTTTSQQAPLINHAAKLLVRDLNSIPIDERNKLMDRIHGVEDIVSESEHFVTAKLEEFDQALGQIAVKDAYNIALLQDRKYVQSRKYCLQFLRAESFDARKAATRMVYHLEEKLRRFGKTALTRPLLLSDIKGAARTVLGRKGSIQVLSARDRRGRVVLFSFLDSSICGDAPNALGDAAFYLMSAVAEDEETQKKGALTITVVGDIASTDDSANLQECIKKGGLWHPHSSPVRINANHIWSCKQLTAASMSVIGTLTLSMGTEFRLLSKIHSESFNVAKHDMKTYGIPVEQLPLSLDGCELRTASHQKWIQRRPAKETRMLSDPNFRGIDLPSCEDVCLLRGTSFHLHPGNLFMRTQMEPHVAEYQTSASGRRRELNDMVIRAVHATGGRFLSRADEGWFLEMTDDAEVNKSVGASFRSLLARTKKMSKKQANVVAASSSCDTTNSSLTSTTTTVANNVKRPQPEPESLRSTLGSSSSRGKDSFLMELPCANKRAKFEVPSRHKFPSSTIAQLSSDTSANPDDSDSSCKDFVVEL